ncbi:MAG: hypothetical protein GVY19_02250 [Bacteroidetes bacterium]|jgi:enoyl reductase-like protein|nr:hypothetical protein [Bacteroidota bacterium]
MKIKNIRNQEIEIKHPVDEQIINHMNEYEKCLFGDLVKNLDIPYNELLKHVIELKNKGLIVKEMNGFFTLPSYADTEK